MENNFDKLVMKTIKFVSDYYTQKPPFIDNFYEFNFLEKHLEPYTIDFYLNDDASQEMEVSIIKNSNRLLEVAVRLDLKPEYIARLINNCIYMDSPKEVGWLHHDGEMSIDEVVLKLMQFKKDGATHINFSPKYHNLKSFDILKKY